MDSVKQYLKQLLSEQEDWIVLLEKYAYEHRIPIMEPVSMNFLTQLIRIYKPKNILEIGTAIGYSALRMHDVYPESQIVTIEKNKEMYKTAIDNIGNQKKDNDIQVLFGEAIEQIERLIEKNRKFDFVFIDAAKAQYKHYFKLVQSVINNNGIIVCDNILFKGLVTGEQSPANDRLQKLANKIKDFNNWLINQKNYHTTILPIGDGVSISLKIK